MRELLKHIVSHIIEMIFPQKCYICGKFFKYKRDYTEKLSRRDFENNDSFFIFKKLFSPFICAECAESFISFKSPYCAVCGDIFKSADDRNHICGACISHPKSFEKARAAGVYKDALMRLIHKLKYNGKTGLAKPLSYLLFYAYLKHFESEKPDIIIPVPLHRKKLRKRGFNQAYLFIKYWKDLGEYPYENEMLEKTKYTRSQTGLTRKEREKNIKNSFKVLFPTDISGKKILLIDDIMTTGATADECAKTLKKKGALKVFVLTLARTARD